MRKRLYPKTNCRSPISWPPLGVVASWSILLFCGFGILSRINLTTLAALTLGSFAIGSAIFLILELNEPYSGLFRVPRGAMQQAIEALRSPVGRRSSNSSCGRTPLRGCGGLIGIAFSYLELFARMDRLIDMAD